MPELSYQVYNKQRLAVRTTGNKKKYEGVIKSLSGRWNPRMKGGEGWLVPIEKEPEIKHLIESLSQKVETLETIQNNAKSRKTQTKYHKEDSDQENNEHENV